MAIPRLRSDFSAAANPEKSKHRRPSPFSIRFSDEERAQLLHEAGVLSLAAYIRLKLFTSGPDISKERKRLTRKHFSPSVELTVLSRMLGELGKSRLSSNLNQIAKAANVGALPVTPQLERKLLEACAAVQHMRSALISAIGIKDQ